MRFTFVNLKCFARVSRSADCHPHDCFGESGRSAAYRAAGAELGRHERGCEAIGEHAQHESGERDVHGGRLCVTAETHEAGSVVQFAVCKGGACVHWRSCVARRALITLRSMITSINIFFYIVIAAVTVIALTARRLASLTRRFHIAPPSPFAFRSLSHSRFSLRLSPLAGHFTRRPTPRSLYLHSHRLRHRRLISRHGRKKHACTQCANVEQERRDEMDRRLVVRDLLDAPAGGVDGGQNAAESGHGPRRAVAVRGVRRADVCGGSGGGDALRVDGDESA